MKIESIKLENFRNYESLYLNLDPGTNLFFGDNAQGKTNILESVYFCGTTKSHRSSKDKDLIRFEQEEAHIRMKMVKKEIPYQIDMHLRKNKAKGIAINGVPIRKAGELLGLGNFVFFSPEDLNIIKSGPGERRRFLDMELCQLSSIYLYHLTNYNKILVQRNKLLKEISFHPEYRDMLDIYDQQMAEYGSQVIRSREDFVERLNDIIITIHRKLSGNQENIKVVYEKNIEADQFYEQLMRNRDRDLKMKMSQIGPHRDDLSFQTDGIDIRKYGSQGQQRTTALSLKLAEIELVKQQSHDTPVLLLDDVLSELDDHRQHYLLESIHDIQTLITCTGIEDFRENHFQIDRLFEVINGTVKNK